MRPITSIAVVAFTLIQAGCVYSVHPVLKQTDLAATYDLSGTWITASEDRKKAGENVFVAEGYSNGPSSEYFVSMYGKEFDAKIGKVGDKHYVQFQQVDVPPEAPPLLTQLPVYGIARIELQGDKLRVYKIDDRRAEPFFKKHKIPFASYMPSHPIEYLVLTGETDAVQGLIKESGDQLFTKEPITFIRTGALKGTPGEPESRDLQSDPEMKMRSR